jgi:hypothetical protein
MNSWQSPVGLVIALDGKEPGNMLNDEKHGYRMSPRPGLLLHVRG